MANIKLTIQHNNTLIEPPVEEGIKIEWERTGSPGKLTFTTPKVPEGGMAFSEGDVVRFYYDEKLVFVGFVFTKKRDREHRIEVTCYDQIRYLKNKYTYVFENKTATQIVKALCADFGLQTDSMDNTNYVIPAIAEENKSALDIILTVLEETLANTGNMYVLFDNAGKLKIANCANLVSSTLIMEDTAENFDYSSSIDDETYNQIVLYYKNDDKIQQIYTASSPTTVNQWGLLRYFEEVDNPSIGQNKANSLLKLYNKKTRELKVTGAFGDISVRGGTLIPVQLNLGDVVTNSSFFMLVEKVTHNFDHGLHTMDLTLEGAWEDGDYEVRSETIGIIPTTGSGSSGASGGSSSQETNSSSPVTYTKVPVSITLNNPQNIPSGTVDVSYYDKNKSVTQRFRTGTQKFSVDKNKPVVVKVTTKNGTIGEVYRVGWEREYSKSTKVYTYSINSITASKELILNWI